MNPSIHLALLLHSELCCKIDNSYKLIHVDLFTVVTKSHHLSIRLPKCHKNHRQALTNTNTYISKLMVYKLIITVGLAKPRL